MKVKIYSIWIVFIIFQSFGYGQKNEFGVKYQYALTKTNISNYSKISGLSYFTNHLFLSEDPSLPVLGKSKVIFYKRKLSKKIQLGLSFRITERGQKSPLFYSINGIADSNLSDNYGGTVYRFTLNSVEIPLKVSYMLIDNGKFNFEVKMGIALDIYREFYIRNYILRLDSGETTPGCCTGSYYRWNGPFFKQLNRHLKEGAARIGYTFGGEIQYRVFKYIALGLDIEYAYYGDVLRSETRPSTLARGNIHALGVSPSISFLF